MKPLYCCNFDLPPRTRLHQSQSQRTSLKMEYFVGSIPYIMKIARNNLMCSMSSISRKKHWLVKWQNMVLSNFRISLIIHKENKKENHNTVVHFYVINVYDKFRLGKQLPNFSCQHIKNFFWKSFKNLPVHALSDLKQS